MAIAADIKSDNHAVSSRGLPPILATGAVLLVLWGLSFALSYVDSGPFALAAALGIAVLKAAIVAAVFMEFWQSSLSIKLTVFAALALLATLIALMVADIETRDSEPSLTRLPRIDAKSHRT